MIQKNQSVERVSSTKNGKTCKKILRCSGLVWCRHHIPNFSDIAEPLNRLLKKKVEFAWKNDQKHALKKLIDKDIHSVVLNFPDFSKQFYSRTEASEVGLGAVLFQKDHLHKELSISLISRSLTTTERAYHACEREFLGIIWGSKKFEHFLDGVPFHLETYNKALIWLNSMRDVNSKFIRWAMKIQDFQPIILHCPGKFNVVSDAISSAPLNPPEKEDGKLVMDVPINNNSNNQNVHISQPFLLHILSSLPSTMSIEKLKMERNNDTECQALKADLPPNLLNHNDILYKKTKAGKLLQYIPSSLRPGIISYFHDSPQSGHMGLHLLRRVYWMNINKEIYIIFAPVINVRW